VRLLVGLGNPGKKYAGTRHNVGFIAIDRLAKQYRIKVTKRKFLSLIGRGEVAGADTLLVKPQTYMNISGLAVRQVVDYFNLSLSDVLVLHDDVDIELGRIKIASGGGSGGHKGMSSVIEQLKANTFPRIKIGIGRPEPEKPVEEFVLNRFNLHEEEAIDKAIERAVQAVEMVLVRGLEETQTYFNRKVLNTKEVGV